MRNQILVHLRLMNFSFTIWVGVSMVEVGNLRCLWAFFDEEWWDRNEPVYSSDMMF